ncbi:alpha/beta hydrolase [Chitinophaga sp. Cy-1792]|uniref:alpha/beta hydrolase n=1 Tax=Chitinophaga sp. Cy-1792 TaxID=2608339 RepID=UPI001420DB5F|nr:alpha/beta hydrolase-fold protein [Chitinophaga sp. Cy-1792]NIG53589.1 alpha/beta hydrolase [Chitinophaga sp. Cy-1792]
MHIRLFFAVAVLLIAGCTGSFSKKSSNRHINDTSFSVYSGFVKDSFTVTMAFPDDYNADSIHRYPVVYVLDANLHFKIYATIMKQYSEVGLIPPVILVGVGYKDFQTMDSLRNRDYTYPVAIPAYEMAVSGGADQFLRFLGNELIPAVNSQLRYSNSRRVLVGHSLGGYFAMFALQQQLAGGKQLFDDFIAASPSLHYNHYYLPVQLKSKILDTSFAGSLYVTYGGLEDAGNADDTTLLPVADVLAALKKNLQSVPHLACKTAVYSGLDHMDTQLPTFIKGLQEIGSK